MSVKKPLKNEAGKLLPFGSSDHISVTDGGTGRESLPEDHSFLGNGSSAVKLIKNNINATTAPTATDDTSQGYSKFSRWLDSNAQLEYICIDASNGAAAWIDSAGASGSQGPQGDVGAKGDQGDAGSDGAKGDQGDAGSDGAKGDQGDTGSTGSKGDQGDIGTQGDAGTKGDQGDQGNDGAKGDQGDAGANGVQGDAGAQGDQGNDGTKGDQGDIGAQGDQGVNGVQGDMGTQGNQGIAGQDGNFGGITVDYLFSTNTTSSDPTSGFTKFNNSDLSLATTMYISEEDQNATNLDDFLQTIDDSTSTIKGHFRVSKKFANEDYVFFTISSVTDNGTYYDVVGNYVDGSVTTFTNNEDVLITFARTGDKGDAGVKGDQGDIGANGPQGDVGAQGADGSGEQGATGAQGDQGATGVQGTDGAQGAQGVQGSPNNQTTWFQGNMIGQANSTTGYFSIQGGNANPFGKPITQNQSYTNGDVNPFVTPYNWEITEVHGVLDACAVSQSTVGASPTMRLAFYEHTSGTVRTLIANQDISITGTVSTFNNLGTTNLQTFQITGISNMSGNKGELIGWEFVNRSSDNEKINALSRCIVVAKIEQTS
jgi:hypothetical protein